MAVKPKAAPVATKKEPSKAVAKVAAKPTAVAVQEDLGELLRDAQVHQEHLNRDDLAIPWLRVLQPMSPQVKPKNEEYVEGAEPGMFYNTLTKELWDGDEGVVVVVASHQPSYTEWWPRDSKSGKGFVADHGQDASIIARMGCTRNEKNKDVTPKGTEIVRSALYHVLVVDPETGDAQQVAFPLQGAQLKKAREWNSARKGILLPHPSGSGKFVPPPYYMAWRITSKYESNDQGDWFGVVIAPMMPTRDLPNGSEVYAEARNFADMINGGRVVTNMGGIVDVADAEVSAPGEQEF